MDKRNCNGYALKRKLHRHLCLQYAREIGADALGSFKFHPKEKWGRVYSHHEAIISQEEFDKAQAIKESRCFIKGKNTDYPWRQHSPLQGFAKCPTCNHILGFVQSKRPRLDGSVRVHRYFHCRICKCNNVKHKNSRAEKLEEQVLALIKEKYV